MLGDGAAAANEQLKKQKPSIYSSFQTLWIITFSRILMLQSLRYCTFAGRVKLCASVEASMVLLILVSSLPPPVRNHSLATTENSTTPKHGNVILGFHRIRNAEGHPHLQGILNLRIIQRKGLTRCTSN